MIRQRENGTNFYHDIKHKIIVGGGWINDGIEGYDINEDK